MPTAKTSPAAPPAGAKKFLITLSGGGDFQAILAEPGAAAWIHSAPPPGFSACWEEDIPVELRAPGFEATIELSRGSYDNDRAMHCPGETFFSLSKAMARLSEMDYEIVGEYSGYIY